MMTKIKIRRFTAEGRKKWLSLYNEIFISIDSKVLNRRAPKEGIKKGFTSSLKKKVDFLKNDFEFTEEVSKAKDLEIKKFKNSYELAKAIHYSLKECEYSDIYEDECLWDWLALQLWDQIFVPGEMYGYMPYRYTLVLSREDQFRHLIRGPWYALYHYGENSKIFTYTKTYQQNDFLEQYIKVTHMREMQNIPEVCMKLYYDTETERALPGVTKGKKGGFPRLRDKIGQFNKVKYLWEMKSEQIINMLPKEFNKYKQRV